MTSSPDKTVEKILVQMLEDHEMELTPVHTLAVEYESVGHAKASLDSHYLSIFLEELKKAHDIAWTANEAQDRLEKALQDRLGGKSK